MSIFKRRIEEERLRYALYGQIGFNESMTSAITYNKSRVEFFHPWSVMEIGKSYGFREYNSLIPIKDFMSMPVDIIDDLLDGVAQGMKEIKKLKTPKKGPLIDPEKELRDLLNEK